ncbi:ATP-binding protein [Streptomyces fuscigenes]|uniref:ATP-binding protein n=1 Tax=Streptomyces fuscigenes TaxID=1528880 RepID=UPI001F38A129|nr:ATP-binding protein [Streptomyces fuscigenes]MCF3961867.1 ATP-binding protein [Streptomyces fuscigenes]
MTYARGSDGARAASGGGLPTRAAEARSLVHALLLRTGLGEGPPHEAVLADALLLTSELVTNALRHGGGVTGFSAHVVDGSLVVTVADASTQVPTARPPRADFVAGGYGWPLVCRLAGTPDVIVTATGKTVRAVLPLHPSGAAPPAPEPRPAGPLAG